MSANFFKMAFVKEIIKEVENLYLSTSLLLHFSKCWKSQTQLEKKTMKKAWRSEFAVFVVLIFVFLIQSPRQYQWLPLSYHQSHRHLVTLPSLALLVLQTHQGLCPGRSFCQASPENPLSLWPLVTVGFSGMLSLTSNQSYRPSCFSSCLAIPSIPSRLNIFLNLSLHLIQT